MKVGVVFLLHFSLDVSIMMERVAWNATIMDNWKA